jgi:hypothetical protein
VPLRSKGTTGQSINVDAAYSTVGCRLTYRWPDQELIALYGMIGGVRVGCLPRTIACAEEVMRATTDTYVAANKTHEMLKSGRGSIL